MKIKAIIVDTNPNEKDSINSIIEKYYSEVIDVLTSVTCIKDAIKSILTLQPEIVFISDELPVLEYLADNYEFEVVFLTNNIINDTLFQYSPIDYIQKPLNPNIVGDVIQKYRCKVKSDCKVRIETFVNNLSNDFELNKKLIFPTRGSYHIIRLCTILYFQAEINYTTLFTLDGKSFTIAVTMKKIEEMLPDRIFFRSHKKYIVNLNYINKLDRDRNKLIFENEIVVDISVRRIERFMKVLSQ
jgi:two-component system LytT family response regulator